MLTHRAVALQAGIAVIILAASGCARTSSTESASRTGAVHAASGPGAWAGATGGMNGKLAGELIAGGWLIGKTKADVKAQLGEPDQEGAAYLDYYVYDDYVHDYSIHSGAGSPAYALRVEFEPGSGHVTDAHIDTGIGAGYAGSD